MTFLLLELRGPHQRVARQRRAARADGSGTRATRQVARPLAASNTRVGGRRHAAQERVRRLLLPGEVAAPARPLRELFSNNTRARRRGRRVARDRVLLVVRDFRLREAGERVARRRPRERRRRRRWQACAGDARSRTPERIERRRRRATPKIAGRAPSTRADLQVSYSENALSNSASTAPRDVVIGTKVPASGTIASEGGGLTGTVDLSAFNCARRHRELRARRRAGGGGRGREGVDQGAERQDGGGGGRPAREAARRTAQRAQPDVRRQMGRARRLHRPDRARRRARVELAAALAGLPGIKTELARLDAPLLAGIDTALDPASDLAGLLARAIVAAPPVVVRDGGVRGVVIRFGSPFRQVQVDGMRVTAGAGCIDAQVAKAARRPPALRDRPASAARSRQAGHRRWSRDRLRRSRDHLF